MGQMGQCKMPPGLGFTSGPAETTKMESRLRAPSHRAALSMSHSLRSELLRPTPVARWRIPYSVAPHLGRWLAGGGASAGWQWRCGVARARVRRTGVRSSPVIYRPIPLQPVPLPSLPLPPVPLPCPCRPPGAPLQREGVQLRRLVDCAPEQRDA